MGFDSAMSFNFLCLVMLLMMPSRPSTHTWLLIRLLSMTFLRATWLTISILSFGRAVFGLLPTEPLGLWRATGCAALPPSMPIVRVLLCERSAIAQTVLLGSDLK